MMPDFYGYVEFEGQYGEFHLLAEVFPFPTSGLRSAFNNADFMERGIPSNASEELIRKLNCIVSENAGVLSDGGFLAAFPDEAEGWLDEGSSEMVFSDKEGKPLIVIFPDYYPTWCSLSELKSIEDKLLDNCGVTYKFLINIMENIDAELGEGCSRLVFWINE
ncbi:hypothetical protein O5O45_11065 [Hahella aquimaris]|uniref:hypothetical protein n=1 Tax=Hahella sp. HNIBRBA332 TaxID=3015983 RepID=UPI00273C19AB|nr:hypothetical protein [Hahella sp. HNIBRBA332]WLQ16460.1 hypothetical protein O5O45_11065 [Hahella sp. HNIBRBA332]